MIKATGSVQGSKTACYPGTMHKTVLPYAQE